MDNSTYTNVSFWLGFVFSLFTTMISGLELAFNVYALQLKDTFNYTQTQVEIIASMGTVGLSLSCLEALCSWILGYKVTCVVVSLGMSISSSLFAVAAYYNGFFHYWPSLIYAMQASLSTLNVMGYTAVSRVCVGLFSKQHTGKVVGLYLTCSCLGKVYFGGILELFFRKNLVGFFISLAIMSAVMYPLCFAFLYPHAKKQNQKAEFMTESSNDASGDRGGGNNSLDTNKENMLKSPLFHIMFWSGVVFHACGLTCVNNVTAISQSAGIEDPLQMVFVCSVVIGIVRFSFGVIFDRFSSAWCGFSLLMISYTCHIFAMLLGMFILDTDYVVLMTILFSIAYGPWISTPVSIVLVQFGRSHYSVVTGTFYAISGICQIQLQVIMGFFYDTMAGKIGLKSTCYGTDCFYWSFFIMLFIVLSIAFVQSFYFAFGNKRFMNGSYAHHGK